MSAIISPCGTYRYRLERDGGLFTRRWETKICWIMVNPSTADASQDDATIRKVRGFTERMGGHRFIVGNLFAYRATDVRALKNAPDPIGPDNDRHLAAMIKEADRVIFAWGASGKMPRGWQDRVALVAALAGRFPHKRPLVLGRCADGQPRHPLMTAYAQSLELWA